MTEQTQAPLEDDGSGRDADLERTRGQDRPAEGNLEPDPQAAADRPVTVSPDPEDGKED